MTPSVEQEDLALQQVLNSSRPDLELAGHSQQSHDWLQNRLDTGQGTQQVYDALSRQIGQPGFLHQLQQARDARTAADLAQHGSTAQGSEVLQPDWWNVSHAEADQKGVPEPEELAEDEFAQVDASQLPPAAEPLESYVMVEREDVVEAIGAFVAAYLVQLPEADKLKPEELQVAVKHAFLELRRGRVRRLWEWGRCIYRCIAFSYGTFSVYQNPWLVRALLAAVWTASKVIIGALI